jgi:hypothetical protein
MSEPPTPSAGTEHSPWGRLAITLLAPVAVLAIERVPLPMDLSTLSETAQQYGVGVAAHLGVASMGVAPFITASVLVELCAVVAPWWAPLRHGGPEGRARLGRTTLRLGLAFAAFQAFATWLVLSRQADYDGSGRMLLVIASLVAGTSLLLMLAELVSRRGLTNGLLLVSVTPLLEKEATRLFAPHGAAPPTAAGLGLAALAVGLTALATWYVLRARPASRSGEQREGTYRAPGEQAAAPPIEVPAPASGTAPIQMASSILMIPVLFHGFGVSGLSAALSKDRTWTTAALILTALLTVALSRLFNDPARVAALAARAGDEERTFDDLEAEARAASRSAITRTLVFVGALFLLSLPAQRLGGYAVDTVSLALATALVLDVLAELRARKAAPDLVAVWPEHRPYAIAAARRALDTAGIASHARGAGPRRLLQFFGPYAPIDLMVPRADTERATEILRATLLPGEEPEHADRPARRAATRARVAQETAPWVRALAALAIAGGALLFFMPGGRSAPEPRARHHAPTGTLEIVPVDDEADPFEKAPDALPSGVSLALENAPTGPGSSKVGHFARIMRGEHETLSDARGRLRAWLDGIALPAGDRFAVGILTEYDEEKERTESIGWRSYVLRGTSTITAADVADAQAVIEDRPDPSRSTYVRVELTKQGGERFAALTRANVKRRVAIVVDGILQSAPVVQTEIPGGVVTITMGTGGSEQQRDDARSLARALGGE